MGNSPSFPFPFLPGSFSNAFHHPSPVENSSVFVTAHTCRALSCRQLRVGQGTPNGTQSQRPNWKKACKLWGGRRMPVELGVGEGSYLEKRRRKGVGGATLYPLKGNTCIQIPSSSLKSREDMVGSFKRKAPYKIRFFFF